MVAYPALRCVEISVLADELLNEFEEPLGAAGEFPGLERGSTNISTRLRDHLRGVCDWSWLVSCAAPGILVKDRLRERGTEVGGWYLRLLGKRTDLVQV